MPRTVPASALVGMMDQETDEVYIVLLTLEHDGGGSPFRFTSDSVDTVFNGDTYEVYPFDITLPTNEQGRVSEARLTIDNVDRRIVSELRSYSNAMTVTITVVASSDVAGGNATATFTDFRLRSVEYNSLTISGRLTVEDFLKEPYPQTIFSQAFYPGLFGQGVSGGYIPPPAGALSTIFSEYATAVFPSGDWQGMEVGLTTVGTPGHLINVRNDEAGANGGQYLYMQTFGTGLPYPHVGIAWREAGWSEDVEVLVNFINITLPTDPIGAIIRYDIWTRGRPVGYRASIDANGDGQVSIYKDADDPDGTQLGSTYVLGAVDTDSVWIRFQAIGADLKAKFWLGSAANEPGTSTTGWNISVTNAELYGGLVGLKSSGTSIIRCDEYGIAYGGASASIIP